MSETNQLSSIEICAGGGGQAIGLEGAGFNHEVLVEIDTNCCLTLQRNRPFWSVRNEDLRNFSATNYKGIDLFAGGVPCPPFSVAGKQLGSDDDRDLFPTALRLISECKPRAIMIENVRGFLSPKFTSYRADLLRDLDRLGFDAEIKLVNAVDFGVSQTRQRVVIAGIRRSIKRKFSIPQSSGELPLSVGDLLFTIMGRNGWKHVDAWRELANGVAPTIVGGSKKHGGADLGPTRAKRAWEKYGVDGLGIANEPPNQDFVGNPKLTVEMVALIQGFPPGWEFVGKKTAAYRQVGNAFPPPVARCVGKAIADALRTK